MRIENMKDACSRKKQGAVRGLIKITTNELRMTALSEGPPYKDYDDHLLIKYILKK